MSNYLIDASAYALPNKISDKSELGTAISFDEYLDNLNNLIEFIGSMDKNQRINYIQFSSNDIRLLIKKELFWDDNTKKRLRNMELSKKNKKRLDILADFFLQELSRLQWSGSNSKPEKLCSIEAYTGIDDIDIKKDAIYTPDIASEVYDKNIAENLKKNICKLAFLNEKIYLDQSITKIIIGNSGKECKVNIVIQKIMHNFNNIGYQDIKIIDNTVLISTFQNLKKRIFLCIDDALENAENDFNKTIEFSENIYKSIDEYKDILAEIRSNTDIDGILKIDNFKNEYPFMVYSSLDILNKLVKFYEKSNKSDSIYPLSKNFNCKKIGENEICTKCRGYLRICGFDCSDENKERIFDNQLYKIHIKPYTVMSGGKYEKLSLRIYFRWDKDKIKIGYIGKHL